MSKPGASVLAEMAATDAATASAARDAAHVIAPAGNRWAHMAAVFGRLVAQGVEDREAALATMRAGAAERLPAMDAAGRDARMAWLLDDATMAWGMARERTRFAIRRALGPLLAGRRRSAELLAAARATNTEAGGPLRDAEVVAEVRREVYWAARRAAKEARRQA